MVSARPVLGYTVGSARICACCNTSSIVLERPHLMHASHLLVPGQKKEMSCMECDTCSVLHVQLRHRCLSKQCFQALAVKTLTCVTKQWELPRSGVDHMSQHTKVCVCAKPVNIDSPLEALEAALVVERRDSVDNLGGSSIMLSLAGGLSC